MIIEMFYPSRYMESTFDIKFDKYYEAGFRGVIFDIDNTLVPHGAPADDRAIEFFDNLYAMGYKALVLSNNKEPRVKMFVDGLNVPVDYIYKANKPSKKGYLDAMKRLGTDKDTTLFVGDQLFTDVWGANRVGMFSILTRPIHPKEEIQIVIKRFFEKIVLFFYNRSTLKER